MAQPDPKQQERTERERKFILYSLPKIKIGRGKPLLAAYIDLPNLEVEMRIRQEGTKRIVTFKLPEEVDGERPEVNLPVIKYSNQLFTAFIEMRAGNLIDKNRYRISDPYAGADSRDCGVCELDIYKGDLGADGPAAVVEREFETTADMHAWQPPQWMIDCGYEEVTGKKEYKNRSLSKKGWPKRDYTKPAN